MPATTIPRAAAILLGLTAVASADCASGSGGSGGGAGGVMTASDTSSSSSTSTGNDPCFSHENCALCPDLGSCATCLQSNHPQGGLLLHELIFCLYCSACFTVCDGAANGCASGPMTMNACDFITPDPSGCIDTTMDPPGGCIPCAEASTCKPQLDACNASPDCVALQDELNSCPTN